MDGSDREGMAPPKLGEEGYSVPNELNILCGSSTSPLLTVEAREKVIPSAMDQEPVG